MIIKTNELEYESVGEGVKRKVLSYSHNIMAVEVCFEPGAIGSLHKHPHEQISYVLEGAFDLQIGDKKCRITKGDTYYTKPDEVHGVVAIEKSKLLDVFTPYREDFLKH